MVASVFPIKSNCNRNVSDEIGTFKAIYKLKIYDPKPDRLIPIGFPNKARVMLMDDFLYCKTGHINI